MITTKNKILKMADETLICAYCGNPIQIEKHKECGTYENCEWVSYSCQCNEWMQYEKLNSEINTLDFDCYKKLKKIVKEYEEQRNNIISKTNIDNIIKIIPDKESYVWDVCPPKEKQDYVVR
ncbi:hypothetical protein DVV91_10155 [Clostridium botulinum]|uniref:hypothetical protein n=1 Tax=Clostridium botulinum TaxID=1491 RepID=UPI001966EAC8|nr:hypothetical protein [Clostridium botulinum]MBN1074704.1 hypothetical protein [Clostridium botulinum]